MRLLMAVGASAGIVLWSPFVGQVRAALSAVFPQRLSLVVNLAVALLVGLAAGLGMLRMRERRAFRVGLLAAALVLAAAYAVAAGTGNAEVDAVERFHFVEYGLVTWLFFRAFRSRGDISMLVLPVCAAWLVGIADEWMQWFVPARVGELRDVWLNGVAIACGLVASVGIHPPTRPPVGLRPGSAARIGFCVALTVIGLAVFAQSVHMGYRIDDPVAGAFESRYTREGLLRLSAERAARWAGRSPLPEAAVSREDQYLAEGLWHIRARNVAWDAGDVTTAWQENLILERYYAPLLDVTGGGFRWPAAQRADAASRARRGSRYESAAPPMPMVTWPRPMFWAFVVAVTGAVAAASLRAGGRRLQPSPVGPPGESPSTDETSD